MTLATALIFPCFLTLLISTIDFLEWLNWASEDFNFFTIVFTFTLWMILGIPSTFYGAGKATQATDVYV